MFRMADASYRKPRECDQHSADGPRGRVPRLDGKLSLCSIRLAAEPDLPAARMSATARRAA